MPKNKSYEAKDIEVLEGLLPVRKRPGMYIGNTNQEGLHHLVNEILDNSIDEVVAGYAKNINFHYSKDKSITIKDDGRGIPVDFHPKYKTKRAFEIVLTTLHSGGKFSENIYKTSGGLHGVGISVVNALSEKLEIEIFSKSKSYSQTYSRGKPKTKIKIQKCNKNLRGTSISFIPDKEIFEDTLFSPKKLYSFIKMKAVLVKGTKISFSIDKELISDKTPHKAEFIYPKGIVDYMHENFINRKKAISRDFHLNLELNSKEKCEAYVSFNLSDHSSILSFCNTIQTPDGGSHENSLKNSIIKSLKLFGQKNQLTKSANIIASDLFDYADSFISIFIVSPSFEGQTKKRITMPKLQKQLDHMLKDTRYWRPKDTFRDFVNDIFHKVRAGKTLSQKQKMR